VLRVIHRAGLSPQANLDFEELLFNLLKREPAPLLLFYVNSPCVVLGRSNDEAQWVNRAACEADGIPVLRRFSAGGAVYHDEHNLNISLMLPRELLDSLWQRRGPEWRERGLCGGGPAHVELPRALIVAGLQSIAPGFMPTGRGDISLNGRKVSGSAQRIAGCLALYHATLLLRCPLAAIERYLPIPPDRPGIAHGSFITGLAEEGAGGSARKAAVSVSAAASAWL
jgi:lipoate-protein ligase A